MPTSASSPTQSDVSGLKSYANVDAVLPSSPEAERLTPVPASQSTSASPVDTSTNSHLTPGSNLNATSSNGMSPHAVQYAGVDEFVPYDDEDYLLTTVFNYFQEPAPPVEENVTSASTVNSRWGPSRQSTGLATQSSQLLSPELSDAPSPETPREYPGASNRSKVFSAAVMSRESTHGTNATSTQAPFMAPTPVTIGSTAHISPDPSQTSGHAGAPRVQIESWSRGDSPARVDGATTPLRRKRSRTSQNSSHLAPDQESSQDGSNEDSVEPQNAHQGATARQTRAGLDPSVRQQLNEEPIMSLIDRAEKAQVDEKNQEVSNWLSTSEVGQEGLAPPNLLPGFQERSSGHSRLRARSAAGGARQLQAEALGIGQGLRAAHDRQIPGPGILLDEPSDDEEDDEATGSYVESTPASVDGQDAEAEANAGSHTPEEGIYHPEEAHPWVDPIYIPPHPDFHAQPGTSSAAMMRFAKRARDIEAVSRVATWGTGARRLSDSDLERVFGSGGLFSRLSISKDRNRDRDLGEDKTEWQNFKETVEQAAQRILPKRIPSTSRRKRSEPSRPTTRDSVFRDHTRNDSQPDTREKRDSLGTLRRFSSANKRSPRLNTTAMIASTTGITTLGASASVSSSAAASPTATIKTPFKFARDRLSRHSSQDNGAQSLTSLLAQQGGLPGGGLPGPNLTSPPIDEVASPVEEQDEPKEGGVEQQQVEEEQAAPEKEESKGVAMNLAPQRDMIIPTFDGFKTNIRNVNPRLREAEWLIERLGQEQLRRYKKLVEFKVKHAQAKANGNCHSGSFCVDQGANVVYYPAKRGPKEPKASLANAEEDEDEEAMADGVITESTFPQGVPMPPVKRLPAEFECPLCFQVKKLQKPSDWSKHVHEDLQPFTCTFAQCPEPKSFKRKADWVRHESERHRQLEWWRCAEEGCAHQCFRRDNFVQHLVREHKMPEPKAKAAQPNAQKKAVRGPAKSKARGGAAGKLPAASDAVAPEDKVLHMVETCKHETNKSAMEEPCRFCGNVCNSFKKLTVHLARHMEQISIPVLDLVKAKDVTPETVVSPIENKLPQTMPPLSAAADVAPYGRGAIGASPYDRAAPIDQGLPELVGGFAQLQASTGFHAPGYANMVPPSWSNADPMVSLPAETPPIYNNGGALPPQNWMPQNALYAGERAPPYNVVSMPNAAASVDAYGAMNGGANTAINASYSPGEHMMDAGMEPRGGLSPAAYGVSPAGMSPSHAGGGMHVGYSQAPSQSVEYVSGGGGGGRGGHSQHSQHSHPQQQQHSQQQYYGY